MLQPRCYGCCYCNTDHDHQPVSITGKDNDSLVTPLTWLSNSNNGLNNLSNNHPRLHCTIDSTMTDELPEELTTTIATSSTTNSLRRRKTIDGSLECRITERQRWRRSGSRVKTKNAVLISSTYYSTRDENNNFVCFTFTKTPFICFNFTRLLLLLLALVTPILSSTSSYQNEFTIHDNKNSGQCKFNSILNL